MSNISILKLRKLPISQRLDMITCLDGKQCHDECLFILYLLSEEKEIRHQLVEKTLSILFGDHIKHMFDAYDIHAIIFFKCVDLLFFVNLFCSYAKNNHINQDNFVSIIEKIINSKLDHKDIKEITIILENSYIEYFKNIPTIWSTAHLIEKVPLINKIKMLDFLLSNNKTTKEAISYIRSSRFNYPERSIIRNKIENILTIYDIII